MVINNVFKFRFSITVFNFSYIYIFHVIYIVDENFFGSQINKKDLIYLYGIANQTETVHMLTNKVTSLVFKEILKFY